jgi:hypothetical protein
MTLDGNYSAALGFGVATLGFGADLRAVWDG